MKEGYDMAVEKKYGIKKAGIAVLMVLVFTGCLFVLSFINYSDGDDTFFLQYCGSMGLLEYLKWRYETWTGRMISEGLMHIFFNRDLWLWRIVNAGMLTALPLSLVLVKNKISPKKQLLSVWLALLFYLLTDINTFGYACIWITGSMNYLWPAVCGLLALWAVAAEAFASAEKELVNGKRRYLLSIPCTIIAAMSSEQMGAVILAFSLICIGTKLWKKQVPGVGILIQTAAAIGAFAISSLAPGNALRVKESVEMYMPQFDSLSLGQRLFMLIQWFASSFANENAMLLTAIWIAGIFILAAKLKKNNLSGKERGRSGIFLGGCCIFGIAALAGKVGISPVCDMGIQLSDMTGKLEAVPEAAELTGMQWFALVWWCLALVFTFFLLWELTNGMPVVLLTYLGAAACEVIMILSPTIYSSGERVFFVTGIMLTGILLILLEVLQREKKDVWYAGAVTMLALCNFLIQIPELMGLLAG